MKSRRGFTLIEMMVAVAVVSLLAAVAVPLTTHAVRRQKLRSTTRLMMVNLKNAQSSAAMGKDLSAYGFGFGSGSGFGPAVTPRARYAGLVINSDGYQTFIDADDLPYSGNEVTVRWVQFDEGTNPQTEIVSPPPGTVIQFRSNGTLLSGAATQIVIRDSETGQQQTIEINVAGNMRIIAP